MCILFNPNHRPAISQRPREDTLEFRFDHSHVEEMEHKVMLFASASQRSELFPHPCTKEQNNPW